MSGHDVQVKAIAAMRTVRSLRMNGSFRQGPVRSELKLTMDSTGRCTGSLSTAGKGELQMIRTDKALYLKGDATWYREGGRDGRSQREVDAGVAALAGRWLKGKLTDPTMSPFAESCDMAQMLDSFKGSPKAYKGEMGTVDGRSSIVLFSPEGSKTATWHIATVGRPYLLKIATVGTNPSEVQFFDFNKPLAIDVPADAIDSDQFNRRYKDV
ncbi:hypothetical protein [Streptomyces sp. MS2.AVA.5]|uniref:Uncharacterized protein n=1 Tax=Streptomyces achmelvichensis TaxID=3134111 RepID=A0ACC6Q814_9ACTN